MKGDARITINHDSMVEALQLLFDRDFPGARVVSVKDIQAGYGAGDRSEFEVSLTEKKLPPCGKVGCDDATPHGHFIDITPKTPKVTETTRE